MNKAICKQILQTIDDIEIEGLSLDDLRSELESNLPALQNEINMILPELTTLHVLKQTGNLIDLVPCAAIFIRSHHHSALEALALVEFTLLLPKYRKSFHHFCKVNDFLPLTKWNALLGSFLYELFLETCFFEKNDQTACINPILLEDIKQMVTEYEAEDVLLSTILTAKYCHHLILDKFPHLEMKNTDLDMIDYPMKETILSILPKHGIPKDRDMTRGLQAFYKDTLFHEFNHRCPICGASIPHMLIASHIRPFRDCAHLYETIDYHNGILLCKNHDFLFDQGYFSFLEDGHIVFSEKLLQDDLSHYQLSLDYQLPKQYLTNIRKQFLAYHFHHIFHKH